MRPHAFRSLALALLWPVFVGPAASAEAQRMLIYSNLCFEPAELSGDAAGYRIVLRHSRKENQLTYEWSEGPRMGPVLAHIVQFDAVTGRLRFEAHTDFGLATFRGRATAKALDGFLNKREGEAATHLHLPRVAKTGDPPPCRQG